MLSLRWFESIVFRREKKGKKGERKRKRKREEKMRGEGSGRLVVAAAAPRAFHPRATSGIGSMPDHVAKRAKNVSS